MATNTYKIPGKKTNSSRLDGEGGGIFSMLEKFLRIDQSLAEVIHIHFLPQILFIFTLCIIYIGSRHCAEKKIRTINELENQVEDLKADFTTLKADYKFVSKQSEVAKKAEKLGLIESEKPPFKIIISKE